MELKDELSKVDQLISNAIDVLDLIIPKLELLMSMSDGLYKIEIKLLLDKINQIKEMGYEIPGLEDAFQEYEILQDEILQLQDRVYDAESESSDLYWRNADLEGQVESLEEQLEEAKDLISELQDGK